MNGKRSLLECQFFTLLLFLSCLCLGVFLHDGKLRRVPNVALNEILSNRSDGDTWYRDLPLLTSKVSYFSDVTHGVSEDGRSLLLVCTDTPISQLFAPLFAYPVTTRVNYSGKEKKEATGWFLYDLWNNAHRFFSSRRVPSQDDIRAIHRLTASPVYQASRALLSSVIYSRPSAVNGGRLSENEALECDEAGCRGTLEADYRRRISDGYSNLFVKSQGILSQCYPANRLIHKAVSSWYLYLLVVIAWLHSFASPHPLTLVHIPRLFIYGLIAVFRYLILYRLGNQLGLYVFDASLDFSDHIVIGMASLLLFSIEFVVVGASHRKSERSFGKKRIDRCSSSAAPPASLLVPLIKYSVRCYCIFCIGCICYSGLFTALYFHRPTEVLYGAVIGLVGLYGSFWAVVQAGILGLPRLGLLSHKQVNYTE